MVNDIGDGRFGVGVVFIGYIVLSGLVVVWDSSSCVSVCVKKNRKIETVMRSCLLLLLLPTSPSERRSLFVMVIYAYGYINDVFF